MTFPSKKSELFEIRLMSLVFTGVRKM